MQAVVNIVMSRAPGTDPVTRTIAIALALVHVQIDARFWSQSAPHLLVKCRHSLRMIPAISFVFVGVIMVTSLRSFILQLMKVRTNLRSIGSDADLPDRQSIHLIANL